MSRILAILLLPLGAAPYAAGQCYYTYERLPDPPAGWLFIGIDMNETGHVAALMDNGGDFTRAGFWSPESGIQFVPKPPGIRNMVVGGLNDHDVICGQMNGSAGHFGFLWDRASNQITFIDLPEGAYRVEMNAVNNADQVATTLYFHTPPYAQAVVWRENEFHAVAEDPDIQPLFGHAMTEHGQTAGDAGSSQWGGTRGFWADYPDIVVLSKPLELTSTYCRSMSNNGSFGGHGSTTQSGPNFAYRGVVWQPGGDPYAVSPPPGNRDAFIYDTNDSARAVGNTYRQDWNGPPPVGFVWQNGVQTDLNTLVPGLSGLYRGAAINNRGQVYTSNTDGHYILTPVWLPGDLTGDCHVSVEDLILVLTNFGMPQGSFPRGDVDLDGDVDLVDLTILLAHWGE